MSLRPLLEELVAELRRHQFTVGFAESCTGGLMSSELAKIPGVSDVFAGAIISYSNQVKADLLGVEPEVLKNQGAVSEVVACQMVRGACEKLRVPCAIAVTGVAGPTGGSPEKPVGSVWIAVKVKNLETSRLFHFKGSREQIQSAAVEAGLELLKELLSKIAR